MKIRDYILQIKRLSVSSATPPWRGLRIRRTKQLFCLATIIVLANISFCLAKTVNFELSADKNKISLGSSSQLYLTFNNTQNMQAFNLPEIEGLQFQYLGPSTRMSVVNGQVSSSITHIYTILPLKVGVFKIGPLKFEHQADTYISNELEIEVKEGRIENNTGTEGQDIETADISDKIFLVIQAKKNKAYLNEIVLLTIKLYVNKLGARDIQYPEINHEGIALGEFEQPKQYQETVNGMNYEVIEFNTSIFGLKPGEFRIGPANLKCNLIVRKETQRRSPFDSEDFFGSDIFENFFGKYQSYPITLKSADIPLTILPFPDENKPKGFSGAIGDFDLEVTASPSEIKTGDPITVKMIVRGDGNFSTANTPTLKSEKDFKTYEPQIKQEKYQKIFEQILMPQNANIREIPEVSFSFFNTRTNSYQTITKGPFPIKVSKPDKEEELKIVEPAQNDKIIFKTEEKLGRDIVFIKAQPGKFSKKGASLYKNKAFFYLHLIPLISFILILILYRINLRLKNDLRFARQIQAPRKAKAGIRKANGYLEKENAKEFYDAVFQTLQEYLGDKFHLPDKGITISVIDDISKHNSIDEGLLNKLREIFRDCDAARYAALETNKQKMVDTLKKLEDIIEYFQKCRV